MKISVLYFSLLRNATGAGREERELPGGATVGDLLAQLGADHPALAKWDAKILIAVNQEYADRSTVIPDGAEVAIMPPVQGG
ncbi:MAG: MoaD/ThiS family protein [Verrucomicrobiales bacterium]